VHTLILLLEQEGIWMRIVQGLRSWPQQAELYAKGRTAPGEPCRHEGRLITPGDCGQHPFGATVTKAPPGYSWHQFGLAFDLVPDADPEKPGFQPDWDAASPRYARFLEVARQHQLACGADWRTYPDYPHVQPVELPGGPTDEVRQVFKDGATAGVWQLCKEQYGLALE